MSRKVHTRRGIFFFGILFFLLISVYPVQRSLPISFYEGKSVSTILKMMPLKDKKRLEHFFRESIIWGGLGYVLFGNKPLSFNGYDKKIHPFKSVSALCYAISPRRIQSKNGFETWKKYEKLFPMSRFMFLYEETLDDETFLFINKKNFIQTVGQHADIFKRILNREIDGEELLKEGKSKPLLSKVLANHDELMGILLGFGQENAHLFYLRSQLATEREEKEFCEKFHYGCPWEKEDEEFEKKTNDIGWVSTYITGAHLKNLDLITLPGFIAIIDHPKTISLKKHYLETREKIINFYKNKDFLEATLTLLTSELGEDMLEGVGEDEVGLLNEFGFY